jgi:chemotaxis family two-component system response regulator Rcp1
MIRGVFNPGTQGALPKAAIAIILEIQPHTQQASPEVTAGNEIAPESSSVIDILLVEDNEADIQLMVEILKEGKIPNDFHVVTDGEAALHYVRKQPPYEYASDPGIIFLDLNLPKKSGHEVLAEIKSDPLLRRIPVVVMSSSEDREDIAAAYDQHANCFITKPADLDEYMNVVNTVRTFWLTTVSLPPE